MALTKAHNRIIAGSKISPFDFGAVGDGVADDTTAVQSAIDYALTLSDGARPQIDLGGYTFGITAPVVFKRGVELDGGDGGFKALTGFSGSFMIELGQSTGTDAEKTFSGSFANFHIDGNNIASVGGVRCNRAQNARISNFVIKDTTLTGLNIVSGYEALVTDFEIIASSSVAADQYGILHQTSDSHFHNGTVVRYPYAVGIFGGNNFLNMLHVWSVYTVGEPQMKVGFHIKGQGVQITNCMADSPGMDDFSASASFANGGYGFYLEQDAIQTNIVNSTTFVTSFWNDPSAQSYGYSSKLYEIYVGKVGCSFVNVQRIDRSGVGAFAGDYQYLTTAIKKETNVLDNKFLRSELISGYQLEALETATLSSGVKTTKLELVHDTWKTIDTTTNRNFFELIRGYSFEAAGARELPSSTKLLISSISTNSASPTTVGNVLDGSGSTATTLQAYVDTTDNDNLKLKLAAVGSNYDYSILYMIG